MLSRTWGVSHSGWKLKWFASFCLERFANYGPLVVVINFSSSFQSSQCSWIIFELFISSAKPKSVMNLFPHGIFNRIVCVNGRHPLISRMSCRLLANEKTGSDYNANFVGALFAFNELWQGFFEDKLDNENNKEALKCTTEG